MADSFRSTMPNGSFPIERCTGHNSVESAAKLAHNSGTYSFEEVKAHILRAKAALGCSEDVLPESWESGNDKDADDKTPRSKGFDREDSLRSTILQLESTGNGRTLTGLAVPYGQLAEIKDIRGHYQEMINRGAFTDALSSSRPKMFFEHGQDLRTGKTPIGHFDQVWEEADGVHVKGELFDNELVRPLADAVRAGELRNWSVHFQTPEKGNWDVWTRTKGWDIRTVNKALLPEISLVNSGAYPTTMSVRSSFDQLPDFTGQPNTRSAGGGDLRSDGTPGNGELSAELSARQGRDRILRLKGIIHGKS
jgi:HK97 family phage prohead protease